MKTCQRYGRRTRDEGRGTLERLRVRRQGKSPPGLARMLRSRRLIQVLSFSSSSSEERTRRALQRALVQRGWRAISGLRARESARPKEWSPGCRPHPLSAQLNRYLIRASNSVTIDSDKRIRQRKGKYGPGSRPVEDPPHRLELPPVHTRR